jgi:DNA-directed RNA polymerase I subunit RPA49
LLGQAFGTKKSKKALAALVENSVRSSQRARTDDGKVVLNEAASAILETMQSVTGSMPSKEVLQQAADDQKPRPKMNLEATEPSQVFSLDDLIGDDIIKLLDTRSWHTEVKAGKAISVTSAYVASRVERVMNEGKALKESKKDKILRFYLTLHEWHSAMEKHSRQGWQLPKRAAMQEKFQHVNERVLERIRHKFAPEGYCLPQLH